MKKFIVSTDSTADLYADYMDAHDIRHVSLTYTIEKDGKFTDGLDAFTDYSQYVDFYNQLRGGAFSRTSMLNYESHYQHFLALAKEGAKDVLHFTISTGLSPTVTVARKAAEDVKKDYPAFNLVAVDSLAATIGQGTLVREAVRLRDEGKTVDEANEYVLAVRSHMQYYIIANDLYYLKRGGRVSGASAMIGTVLNIKPFITMNREGKLNVVEKFRGIKKAFSYIISQIKELGIMDEDSIYIVHTDNEEKAEELKGEIERCFGITPHVVIMGPVIGSHVGPGAVAVGFLSNTPRT